MGFSEVIKNNPARLVVRFKRADDGSEMFEWGVVGSIPILTLLGGIIEVQDTLVRGMDLPDCDGVRDALVLVWDQGVLLTYVDPEIPVLPLIGMLETIKFAITSGNVAQRAASRKVQLFGLDGRPYTPDFNPEGA